MVKDADHWLDESGQYKVTQQLWNHIYGQLSLISHPRSESIAMEFDKLGQRILSGPEWNADHCLMALAAVADASVMVLHLMQEFSGDISAAAGWRSDTGLLIAEFDRWLEDSHAEADVPATDEDDDSMEAEP